VPVPIVYTEGTLAAFIHQVLGPVADALTWSVGAGSYDEIINETLFKAGQTDLSLIVTQEDIRKLRTLARLEAWRAVVDQSASDISFEADGGRYSREQFHKMAAENFAKAESAAAEYDDRYRVGLDRLDFKHDPYRYRDEENRTL
jgi:hypothetical protein